MQNWNKTVRFGLAFASVCAVLASYSWAQSPSNVIKQPGPPANSQRQLPAAGQTPGVPPIGATVPGPAATRPITPNAAASAPATQPGGNQPMAPAQAEAPMVAMGQAPFPPLAPAYQKFLDDVLAAWEKSTKGIDRFQCKFSRWQYDPTKTNDPNEFYTAASGVLRYMAPDKGMFKVEDLRFRKQKPDGSWGHEAIPDQYGEWWICDGKSVHLYDQTQKHAKKYPLPPNMQGAEVFNSPLPFVFGVNAEKVNSRFWLRPVPPPPGPDGKPNDKVILLEAYPKHQSDAMNYHHVSIYLDRQEVLPLGIVIFLPNWTPLPQNDHKEVFEFREREVNAGLLAKLTEAVFRQSFIPIEPPKGWTVEEVPFVPEEDPQRVAAPSGQPQNSLPR